MAGIVALVGLLLSVNNFTVVYSIRSEIEEIRSSMCATSTLCSEYLKINDKDYLPVRDKILLQCTEQLRSLNNGTYDVSGNNYYKWMSEQVKQCKKSIIAISGIAEYLWIKDKRESQFFSDNIDARKRGVIVKRIFTTSNRRLSFYCNRIVLEDSFSNNMQTFVVYLSDITDTGLKRNAEKGMLLLDDDMLFLDIDPPEVTSGQAHKSSLTISKYKAYFENLSIQAIDWATERNIYFDEIQTELTKKYSDGIEMLLISINENVDFEKANDFMNWRASIINKLERKYSHLKNLDKIIDKSDAKLFKLTQSHDFTKYLLNEMHLFD